MTSLRKCYVVAINGITVSEMKLDESFNESSVERARSLSSSSHQERSRSTFTASRVLLAKVERQWMVTLSSGSHCYLNSVSYHLLVDETIAALCVL